MVGAKFEFDERYRKDLDERAEIATVHHRERSKSKLCLHLKLIECNSVRHKKRQKQTNKVTKYRKYRKNVLMSEQIVEQAGAELGLLSLA